MNNTALKTSSEKTLNDRFTFRPTAESLEILSKARNVGLDISAILNECVSECGNRVADRHAASLKARLENLYAEKTKGAKPDKTVGKN